MNQLQVTLSGQEGFFSRCTVLKVALRGVQERHPGANDRARRVARSLRALARNYGIAELIEAAWIAEEAPDEHLVKAVADLLEVLESAVMSRASRTAVILVVEDDPMAIGLLRYVLTGPGHEVVVATTLGEAEVLLTTHPVSLVVLDLRLPDGDGRDLLVRLREQAWTATLPVVILSAEGRSEVKAECLALGADEYLEKTSQVPMLAAAISAKIRREAETARLARRDTLTGLPNRLAFEVAFEQFRAHSRRTRRPMALGLIDLDHFKRVNDTWGHLVGDEVLAGVAAVLSRTLRQSDFVARWGGEEMVAMFPDTDAFGATIALQKALDALRAEPFTTASGDLLVQTFSAGVVEAAPDAGLAVAVSRADKLLYEAKQAGRDRIQGPPATIN